MTPSQPGLAGWTSPNCSAFGEKPGTGSSVDRAIHPASTKQRGVRGVDDRIDLQLGYIAVREAYPPSRIRAGNRPSPLRNATAVAGN